MTRSRTHLENFSDVFCTDIAQLQALEISKHKIDSGNARPIAKIPYRQGQKTEIDISNEIDRLLQAEIIRHSISPWRSRAIARVANLECA